MDEYAKKNNNDRNLGTKRATGKFTLSQYYFVEVCNCDSSYLFPGLTKTIIDKLHIPINVPDELMTLEDAVSLLETKTAVKPYVLEMLHYGYKIPLQDIIKMSNSDTNEILENFNKEFVNVSQKITDAKITWHHDKKLYKTHLERKFHMPMRATKSQQQVISCQRILRFNILHTSVLT